VAAYFTSSLTPVAGRKSPGVPSLTKASTFSLRNGKGGRKHEIQVRPPHAGPRYERVSLSLQREPALESLGPRLLQSHDGSADPLRERPAFRAGLPAVCVAPLREASVQPKAVRRFCRSSHAKSLWSQGVPKCRGINARFLKKFFKMTFASSNPPTPARQFGQKIGLALSPRRRTARRFSGNVTLHASSGLGS
jgi:hypothetical protein